MSWSRLSDGTGKDSAGHTCGAGFIATLLNPSWSASQFHFLGNVSSTALAQFDGTMSETYISPDDSILTLSNGVLLHYDKVSNTIDSRADVVVQILMDTIHSQSQATLSGPIKTAIGNVQTAVEELVQKAGM